MKFKFITLLIILTAFIAISILNLETNTKKGINYVVNEQRITVGNKIYDFFKRHYFYKKLIDDIFLEKKIFLHQQNKINNILLINNWLLENIKPITEGETIIDFHPITIIKRAKATSDQFNDLYSILLVYNKHESFYKFISYNNVSYPFTFVKIDNFWTIIDPYNGFYFVNENNLASINDIKNNNFEIFSLHKNNDNSKYIFFDTLVNEDILKNKINKIFINFNTKDAIISKHKYKRGGRSYLQDPINRLKYEILKILNII